MVQGVSSHAHLQRLLKFASSLDPQLAPLSSSPDSTSFQLMSCSHSNSVIANFLFVFLLPCLSTSPKDSLSNGLVVIFVLLFLFMVNFMLLFLESLLQIILKLFGLLILNNLLQRTLYIQKYLLHSCIVLYIIVYPEVHHCIIEQNIYFIFLQRHPLSVGGLTSYCQ